MKLSEFITMSKLQIPNIKETGIDAEKLTTILNQAVNEVNLITKVYKSYTDFNITADTVLYQLSTIAPNFLGKAKGGLWIKDENDVLTKVYPKSLEWLNQNIRFWREAESSGLAIYYYIEGDDLGIHPAIDENRSNGGRLYHLKKAGTMANDDHYPFSGSTTEIAALRPLDKAILAYTRWKVAPVLVQETMEDKTEQVFIKECIKGMRQIKRDPDLMADYSYGMQVE